MADDVVLLLDADEIVNRETLLRLRDGLDRPTRLDLTRHYEYGDLVAPRSACCVDPDAPFAFDLPCVMPKSWLQLGERWCDYSGIAVRFRDLSSDPATGLPPRSAYDLRRLAHAAPRWANAGRHFVGVDPATTLERKLARVSHTEWSDHRTMAAEHLRRVRHYGVHHHGWWDAQRPRGELPANIARLDAGSPVALRRVALPPMLLRRMARTWAWLCFCAALTDGLVRLIDRHFELLLPLWRRAWYWPGCCEDWQRGGDGSGGKSHRQRRRRISFVNRRTIPSTTSYEASRRTCHGHEILGMHAIDKPQYVAAAGRFIATKVRDERGNQGG